MPKFTITTHENGSDIVEDGTREQGYEVEPEGIETPRAYLRMLEALNANLAALAESAERIANVLEERLPEFTGDDADEDETGD
jgi:hypothetical protein